jgi:hypothetical protein
LPRRSLFQGLREIGKEVAEVFDADGESYEGVVDAEFGAARGGNTGVGHEAGVFDEAFDAAEGFGKGEEAAAFEEASGAGETTLKNGGDHATAGRHLPAGEFVLGVGREAGVEDALDVGAGFEEAGDFRSVVAGAFHAEGEGFDAAVGEEAVEGGGDGADGVLEEGEAVEKRRVVTDDGEAADHVGVAVDVFGDGVDDDVEAEGEGALDVRRGEGVVGDGEEIVFCGERGECGEIGEFEQGVAGGFDPEHAGVGADGALDGSDVGGVDVGDVQRGAFSADAFEEAVGAAVEIVAGDDVGAGVEEFEDGGCGGQSGGEGKTGLAVFEVGDAAFEGPAGGVVAAGVVEAFVDAGGILFESARGVDRGHHRVGRWIGDLAGVDDAGGEVGTLASVGEDAVGGEIGRVVGAHGGVLRVCLEMPF